MLIRVTVAVSASSTYTDAPVGVIVGAIGDETLMVAFTSPVAVSMTVSVSVVELDTYSLVPSCFTAMPSGVTPAANVPITVPVMVSITVTVPALRFVT